MTQIKKSNKRVYTAAPASKLTLGLLTAGLMSVAFLLASGNVQAAGSIEAGTKKARACQVCHGKDGYSTNPAYPILAGQHDAYLQKQLRAFRAGTRKDPIMNGMAAPLTDQDIEDIAAFFQSRQ